MTKFEDLYCEIAFTAVKHDKGIQVLFGEQFALPKLGGMFINQKHYVLLKSIFETEELQAIANIVFAYVNNARFHLHREPGSTQTQIDPAYYVPVAYKAGISPTLSAFRHRNHGPIQVTLGDPIPNLATINALLVENRHYVVLKSNFTPAEIHFIANLSKAIFQASVAPSQRSEADDNIPFHVEPNPDDDGIQIRQIAE